MRIFSELSTDEALEVVLQIAQPIINLIDDEALVKEMQKRCRREKRPLLQ